MTQKKGYILSPDEAKHEDFSSPEAYILFFKLRILSGLLMSLDYGDMDLVEGEVHALGYILNDIADDFRQMDAEIMSEMEE